MGLSTVIGAHFPTSCAVCTSSNNRQVVSSGLVVPYTLSRPIEELICQVQVAGQADQPLEEPECQDMLVDAHCESMLLCVLAGRITGNLWMGDFSSLFDKTQCCTGVKACASPASEATTPSTMKSRSKGELSAFRMTLLCALHGTLFL